jgi:hypothetical protein
MGLMGLVAVTSGIYLFNETQNVLQRARSPMKAAVLPRDVIVDQVHQSAMAPTRLSDEQSPASTPAQVPAAPASQTIPSEVTALVVQPRAANAILRAGPGTEFPVLGHADPSLQYLVADWNQRWFKISLPQAKDSAQKYAWIRNDLVQLVSGAKNKQQADANTIQQASSH